MCMSPQGSEQLIFLNFIIILTSSKTLKIQFLHNYVDSLLIN